MTPVDLEAVVRATRAARGWTQQEAADAAGVSRRFVNMVEGGRHPNAENWRVLALMDALRTPLHAIGPAPASPASHGKVTAAGTRSRGENVADHGIDAGADFDLDARWLRRDALLPRARNRDP
jgi:transcriptional regulator with XRE-family HTH domain